MKKIILVLSSVCLLSCYARQVTNPPSQIKLRLLTHCDEYYRVLVATEDMNAYTPNSEGKVELTIPELGNGCRVSLLGIIPIENHGATSRKIIYIFRAEDILDNLSLNDIYKLPVDDQGYRILTVK